MSKEISLSKNKKTIVDDDMFDYLNQWKWFYSDGGYAIRHKYINTKTSQIVRMHRLINKTPEGMMTDHINGNKLDNRKENLRTADKQLNAVNSKIRNNNKSGIKGCYFDKNAKKWRVQIKVLYKTIHLGYFNDLLRAKTAREFAEKKYYGI